MPDSKQLGKYRLIRRLGRGGMGSVYEAEDTALRRRIALKVLPPRLASNRSVVGRFLREAQAAAKLGHPNVVIVHEVGEQAGVNFIAMELIAGSAEARIAAGPMPWQDATGIAADACRGLAAAHDAGLIHRDVKPSNILIADDGRGKLADFGLVKPTDPDATSLTAARAVVGTPHFMSPEQCRGERVTRLADIYALGATYYTLLTGRAPFPMTDPLQVMMAHCSSPPPDPRKARPDIPEACADIVRRALAKEPADRFPSADEFLDALESALIGDAVMATPPPRPVPGPVIEPARPIAPRGRSPKRGPLAHLGGVAAVLVALVLAIGWHAARSVVSPWKPLFNGKNMTGLFVRADPKSWTVKDGHLVGAGYFNYVYTNRDDFQDFHCRVEMKLNAAANSGIVFRCVPEHGMPHGYEAQLGDGQFGGLYLGPSGLNPADPITTRPLGVPPDTWFTVEVIVKGPNVTVKIDGVTVTEFVEVQPTRARGHLGIQSGSKDTIVTVRKFEVRDL